MKKLLLGSVAVALAMTCASAAAANLADLETRELWSGEEWTAESLKDRVVVIEFWGYN